MTAANSSGEALTSEHSYLAVQPSDLAASVRELALECHRLLRDAQADTAQRIEAGKRIEALRVHCLSAGAVPLEQWLSKASAALATAAAGPEDPHRGLS